MRIVQYIPDFGLGGVQKAGCVLGRQMARLGHATTIVGNGPGPRMEPGAAGPLTHQLIVATDPAAIADALLESDPQVVHIHAAAYRESLVNALFDRMGHHIRAGTRAIVSTPVFGRPPLDRSLLDRTRTCCVGVYTFYRLNRWLGLSSEQSIARGMGYVPLTPYDPPAIDVSANDAPDVIERRRAELGLPAGAFIVGRIGRNDPGKWHANSQDLVDSILSRYPTVAWLSVGYPEERGASRLQNRWADRFRNLPETPDYGVLTRVLASLDVQIFFSSNGECFASSISEAAGIGVPTIALATPLKDNGQAEQVIEQVTGTLVASIAESADAIGRYSADANALARLKQSTQLHARNRWHVARVSTDLLSLYESWLPPSGTPAATAYSRTMLSEAIAFGEQYRRRITLLMGRTPASRARWRLALAAVESWKMFRIGRFIKRLRHPVRDE